MPTKKLEDFPDWLEWLNTNFQRQCEVPELTNILLQNGFSRQSIDAAIFAAQSSTKSLHEPQFNKIDYLKLSQPHFTQTNYSCPVHQIVNTKLQLYLIYDFLSSNDCDALVEMSKARLTPSTVANPEEDKEYRTNQTAHFPLNHNPIISSVDNKISDCLGIDKSYGEPSQIQHYGIGHQYKKHHDFFFPNNKVHQRYLGRQGNRTWTFMVYLNDVNKGGATRFLAIEQNISPQKGLAVVWNNRYPNGQLNYDSLHAGLPIEDGEKTILTKWFREHQVATNGE